MVVDCTKQLMKTNYTRQIDVKKPPLIRITLIGIEGTEINDFSNELF